MLGSVVLGLLTTGRRESPIMMSWLR